MIGSIIGDIAGSLYEFSGNTDKYVRVLDTTHPEGYEYTDDTVMSCAVARCILDNLDPTRTLQEYGRQYQGRGYGGMFYHWLVSDFPKPYNSFGNGAAMRINPVGFLPLSINDKLAASDYYTEITHNHPEGIKGARSVVDVMDKMLYKGWTKDQIREYVVDTYGYNLDDTVENLRFSYSFDETCQQTVPQAFICFLDSVDFEDSIRNAISINGDADTLACIVGGLSEAYYKDIPFEWVRFARVRLDHHLLNIVDRFEEKYGKFYKEN